MKIRYFAAASSLVALALSAPVLAAEDDGAITVLATGHSQPVDQTGQSISVVDLAEIQSIQGPDLTRVLTRLPGVSFARAGGLGATTSFFVRGANSEQTLVMIDGVKVEDTAAPSGGYDFANLVSGGVGSIELLRGSNSVVWGSNAIGGVIAITSREINGAELNFEGGSNNTFDAGATLGVARDAYAITLNGGYLSTDGIPTRITDTRANGFHQTRLSTRARLRLAQGLNLVAAARYAEGKVGVDSYDWSLGYVNRGEQQSSEQVSGRVGLEYAAETYSARLGISQSSLRRGYIDPTVQATEYSSYLGRSTRIDGAAHVDLPYFFAADVGGEAMWNHARNYYFTPGPENDANIASGYGLLGWRAFGLSLSGGLRVDSHSTFGTHTSFGANGSYNLIADVRLRASYGEGFRAPTLYQLFDPYSGSKTLKAETSKSYDVGLEKGDRNGKLYGAVTWFHRDTNNQIDYDLSTSTYANLGRTRAEGLEFEAGLRPVEALQLRALYTFVKSTNQTAGSSALGKDLARRPRHMVTWSADWKTPLAGLAIGGDIRVVSSSFDNAANSNRLAGYALFGLRASIPVGDHAEIFGRIENLTNERYAVVKDYNSYGRTAALGLRAKL
ncbi:vitamin B12 transporter [Novosphingobium sp. SG751A]|uniref:TonB-dependent receptor plug domain-containing protein n=1 Tax=Novosphingobium sp. SG751A TaxID=2587000 RepID=UPI0015575201|nr:TonB-dependent receptor [Novosphingobium sp. SG751A]NOW46802.1 vitamin B12 transporter [Novosphingobium sp. SG751A]